MTDTTRQQLLDAALQTYADAGFRGATTRRIAEAAGVNEVTLFRLFKSKEGLISEALACHSQQIAAGNPLPDRPGDAEAELTAWAVREYAGMRESRGMIRKVLGDMEEHPQLTDHVCNAPSHSYDDLCRYLRALNAQRRDATPTVDPTLAASMLMSALFADVMVRDAMPHMFPLPVETAATQYVRLVLRALGLPSDSAPAPAPASFPVQS